MNTISKMLVVIKKIPTALLPKPTPLTYIGAGKVLEIPHILQTFGVKKVLIVTDKSLMSLGLLKPMIDAVETCGIKISIYDDVQPDPTYNTVKNGLAVCKKNHCDGIIAFGGGSVLDAAKVISAAFTNQCEPESLEGLAKVKVMRLPLIAVPTTAGTGSETTIAAIISDPETHRKTTVIDGKLVPDAAILDPELTVGLPPHITAATAMDALTHAIEAYVSDYATVRSKRLSEAAICLIYENIEQVFKHPDDVKAREELLLASFLAGMAFTSTYVGYVHAFAHNYGGKFGIPHGLANAVILPHIMDFYIPSCTEQFARLSDILGLGVSKQSKAEQALAFVNSLWTLNKTLNIPGTLEKFPKSAVPEICAAAFKECHGTYPVPAYLNKQQALAILNKISV